MASQFCNITAHLKLVSLVLKTTKLRSKTPKISTSAGTKAASPHLWLLLDDRPGHNTQVKGLARRLTGSAEDKHLTFNFANYIPTPMLGANLWSVRKNASSPFEPPYPDLVIGMGRRIVPAARWIARKSGGRTRVVLLGRKAANNPKICDIAISCTHFNLLPAPGLVELIVPPTQVDDTTLNETREASDDPMSSLARPHVVFLVGGVTAQHDLSANFAAQMTHEIARATTDIGGGLAIVTSRRTPGDVVEAIKTAAPDAHLHEWNAKRTVNPYLSYLAYADLLVVTGESESMLAEAVATTRPLTVFPLNRRRKTVKQAFAGLVRAHAEGGGLIGKICHSLLTRGWVTAPRNLAVMHSLIEDNGLGRIFDGQLNQSAPKPNNEIAQLAGRIAALSGHAEGSQL